MSKYRFGKRSLENLKGVHPDLVKVANTAISLGVMDFSITTGVRTVKEQERLYAQGRTQPGPIVTWTLNSRHLIKDDGYGHAIDVAPYPINWEDVEAFHQLGGLIKAAAAFEKIDIDWGYDLWGKDLPHFQLGKSYYQ